MLAENWSKLSKSMRFWLKNGLLLLYFYPLTCGDLLFSKSLSSTTGNTAACRKNQFPIYLKALSDQDHSQAAAHNNNKFDGEFKSTDALQYYTTNLGASYNMVKWVGFLLLQVVENMRLATV